MGKDESVHKVTPQSQKFVESARELGCDEDEAAFDAKLKKVAAHKPPMATKDQGGKSGTKK